MSASRCIDASTENNCVPGIPPWACIGSISSAKSHPRPQPAHLPPPARPAPLAIPEPFRSGLPAEDHPRDEFESS